MKPARLALAAVLHAFAPLPAQDWQPPAAAELVPRPRGDAPVLACTAAELANLRAAFARGDRAVTSRVDRARERLSAPVSFPPRGGQHNQWYQCDRCQRALVTVDDTHHRCPGCGQVYSGPPYDDVVFSRQHGANLQRAADAAWAFAIAGERALAGDAAAILLGYADRYEQYPYHSNDRDPTRARDSGGHLEEQTLSEASMLVREIAPAVDLTWPTLDAAQREHVLQHLVRPMVANIAKCKRGKSNWQSWHNAAMFCGGLLLGDAGYMQRSVLDARNGLLFQLRSSVAAEGMWYENSFGYHNYTLGALCAHADAARVAGIDLFGHPVLQRMCLLPARYVMADGKLPRLGDDVDSSPRQAAAALEAAFAATHDERLRAVLGTTATWDSVRHGRDVSAPVPATVLGSEVFRSAGHAVLRSQGPARMSALMTFAPFGGFHDHFDKLSFVWHAFASERGVDPGRARSQAYRLPIHAGWYRATLAHDTVVVDGHSQRESGGELLAFESSPGFSAVAARTSKAWRGVEHSRCLLLTDDCLVVLDHLSGDGEHTFDWLYHDRGPAAHCAAAASAPGEALGVDGEQYVHWLGAGSSEEQIEVAFTGGPVSTALRVAAGGPTTIRLGTGPVQSVDDRVPFVLLRRRGARATFAAVLQAATRGHEVDLTGVRCETDPLGTTVAVERGATVDRFWWNGRDEVRRLR
ncbi:MAG TPA: heparinase II/III family protein [Planctomycetota bacterium]|nr:heparinase II/III family protein [Planctomycetota bacterium]